MTTIAFDGKVLAADRGCSMDGIVFSGGFSKIIIIGDMLIAGAGTAAAWRSLAHWHAAQPKGEEWRHPAPSWGDGYGCEVIERGGRSYTIEESGAMLPAAGSWAQGSGRLIALGALGAGASAIEAVRIACSLDQCTVGPIDYVVVEDDPWVILQAPAERADPPSLRVVGA